MLTVPAVRRAGSGQPPAGQAGFRGSHAGSVAAAAAAFRQHETRKSRSILLGCPGPCPAVGGPRFPASSHSSGAPARSPAQAAD